MTIPPISSVLASLPALSQPTNSAASTAGTSFSQFLASEIGKVNNLSNQADALSASYAAGGPVSVDQLMIAEQQASLAVDLVTQVQNRVVSAYQTVMNMQV